MNHSLSVIVDGALFMFGWKMADLILRILEVWIKNLFKFVKNHLTY